MLLESMACMHVFDNPTSIVAACACALHQQHHAFLLACICIRPMPYPVLPYAAFLSLHYCGPVGASLLDPLVIPLQTAIHWPAIGDPTHHTLPIRLPPRITIESPTPGILVHASCHRHRAPQPLLACRFSSLSITYLLVACPRLTINFLPRPYLP